MYQLVPSTTFYSYPSIQCRPCISSHRLIMLCPCCVNNHPWVCEKGWTLQNSCGTIIYKLFFIQNKMPKTEQLVFYLPVIVCICKCFWILCISFHFSLNISWMQIAIVISDRFLLASLIINEEGYVNEILYEILKCFCFVPQCLKILLLLLSF